MAKRKYAVLVGCNYPNTENELQGCVNDVMRMQHALIHRFGFAKRNINLLIDTDEAYTKPTGENIRAALLAMIRRAKSGDVLFFHYSGHGTLARMHKSSRYDECIVPCDFNLLTDEDFRFIVNKVPLGATFTMVSDSCHSGGLIDKEKEQIGPHAHSRSLTDPEKSAQHSSKSKFLPLDSLLEILREKTGEAEMEAHKIAIALFQLFGDKASSKVKRLLNTNGSVVKAEKGVKKSHVDDHVELQQRIDEDMGILLSGCQTNQTSADACPTGDPKKAYGAFSNAIQTILEQHGKPISNRELVLGTRKSLVKEGYSQHPCLYCSDNNADAAFLCEESTKRNFHNIHHKIDGKNHKKNKMN
eukprot:PITA_00779